MPRKKSIKKKPARPSFKKADVATRLDQVFRSLFESQGLTLADIAEAIGVHPSLPGKWIKRPLKGSKKAENSVPNGEQLANIAAVFDVSADWLLTGHGPANRSAMMEPGTLEQALAERLEVAIRQRMEREGIYGEPPLVDATRLLEHLVDRGVEEARRLADYQHYNTALHVVTMIHELAHDGPERLPELHRYATGKALENVAYGPGEMSRPDTDILHWRSTSLSKGTP